MESFLLSNFPEIVAVFLCVWHNNNGFMFYVLCNYSPVDDVAETMNDNDADETLSSQEEIPEEVRLHLSVDLFLFLHNCLTIFSFVRFKLVQ